MKKLFTYLFLCLPLAGFSQLSNGLLVYLPFDGNLTDQSGNGRNATFGSGQSFVTDIDRSGNNCAGNFSASYFNIPFGNAATTTRSLSFWVKLNQNTGDYVFESGALPLISRVKDSLKIDLFNYNRTGYTFYLEQNKWAHVAWVYTPQGVHSLYFNGIEKHILTKPVQLWSDGSILTGNAGTSLDDLRIYDRALSPNEITALYALGSSCVLTNVEEELPVTSSRKLLFASDPMGGIVAYPAQYKGLLILHFEDGTSEKIFSTF